MNIRIALIFAACLCAAAAAADVRGRKQQRPTRGFKTMDILTARGFGKRNIPLTRAEQYGIDNFWDSLENLPEREAMDQTDDRTTENIPVTWFVNEMMNNPDFAKSVVRKFIDANQDGLLSPEELLRN